MKFLLLILLLATVLIAGCTSVSCPVPNEKYCENDSDCMCSTSPCFLGNKEYFDKCIADKSALGACLDACGFGPYEMEFRYICENSQCIIATFNRTTGQRITHQYTSSIQESQTNTEVNQVSLCKGTARCFNGTVTEIIDGDTLKIDNVSIRLALIDAPEYYAAGYNESKAFVSNVCPVGSTATVDEDDGQNESYGRIVAVVYCNIVNLNARMAANEYVIIDKRYCNISEFAEDAWVVGC